MASTDIVMIVNISTVSLLGLEIAEIIVQVQVTRYIPSFQIVGLPDKVVSESKERVRAAISSMGLNFPASRIVVNLSPADLEKCGNHYDLVIILGILQCMKVIPDYVLHKYLVMGEIGLDGSIRAVRGVLPATVYAHKFGKGIICPIDNGYETTWFEDIDAIATGNVKELVEHLNGKICLKRPEKHNCTISRRNMVYMEDIKGHAVARRFCTIAAAGRHNLAFIGSPGTGKSMLAHSMIGISPEPALEELLEINAILSITGEKSIMHRPFRAPHSSSSVASIIGGGSKSVMPGEVTLAHNGILLLDEFPEFTKQVIESLRQPMEDKVVTVARVNHHVTYPANFQFIATMNPCKCGYYTNHNMTKCSRKHICNFEYLGKISGPIWDRIDICVRISEDAFVSHYLPSTTAEIIDEVNFAVDIQKKRYAGLNGIKNNSQLNGRLLDEFVVLDNSSKELLDVAISQGKLSTRGYVKVLRVARTIADLEGSDLVGKAHVTEALACRSTAILQ